MTVNFIVDQRKGINSTTKEILLHHICLKQKYMSWCMYGI